MKKILTVSLFAMMAVSAANADIASTKYVTDRTGTVSFTADGATKGKTNLTEAIAAVDAQVQGLSGDLMVDIAGQINELNNDIAAINNESTGILAQAKADAKSKADAAQSAAEAKVTALQNGAVKTNADNIAAMDTAYKAADTAIKNTIGTVTQGKTVVEMISEAQTNATYDDTAVRGLINGNANEISAIKNSAYATSGVTSAVVNQVETNKNDISAINNESTGILAQAKADAKSKADAAQSAAEAKVTALQNGAVKTNADNIAAMDTAYKAADTAIKNTIGTVTDGKTVVQMINEASTNAGTNLTNALKDYSTTTEMNTAITNNAVNTVVSGSANGTIAVDGKDVAVKGLGSAAYTPKTDYATSAQGTKADNAVARTQIGAAANFAITDECKAPGAVCSLVVRAGVAGWEKVIGL